MKEDTKQTVGRSLGVLSWLPGIMGGILLLALLHNPGNAFSASLPNSYSVTMAWERSPSQDVFGDFIYYGGASGIYATSVVAGDAMTNTVTGLASGVTYLLVITDYTASGLESPPSNHMSYMPGLPKVRIHALLTGQVALAVKGLINHAYDIEATEDFKGWTVIGTVTLDATGSLDVTDTNAASFPERFYRT